MRPNSTDNALEAQDLIEDQNEDDMIDENAELKIKKCPCAFLVCSEHGNVESKAKSRRIGCGLYNPYNSSSCSILTSGMYYDRVVQRHNQICEWGKEKTSHEDGNLVWNDNININEHYEINDTKMKLTLNAIIKKPTMTLDEYRKMQERKLVDKTHEVRQVPPLSTEEQELYKMKVYARNNPEELSRLFEENKKKKIAKGTGSTILKTPDFDTLTLIEEEELKVKIKEKIRKILSSIKNKKILMLLKQKIKETLKGNGKRKGLRK